MNSQSASIGERNAPPPLEGYYRWHSRIYDLTRWAFLFGRNELVTRAAAETDAKRILEIGCGTGKNLVALAKAFPDAEIVGLDLSADMLSRAQRKIEKYGERVSLLHRRYDSPVSGRERGFDLIVFSYSLSMINPGFDQVIERTQFDLTRHGVVAVADFHDSRWNWFRRWMGVNHVVLKGQILEHLEDNFIPVSTSVSPAYGGLWRYLVYFGKAV